MAILLLYVKNLKAKKVELRLNPRLKLKVVFSPEHGLFGEADKEITYANQIEDLPKVYSLYGSTRKPTKEMLDGIDMIIYDIQDIGARFPRIF